jgi:hypothetical protein
MGDMHLQDAMVEFARFLLANGATLAYGGDLRIGGNTEILFQVAEAYNKTAGPHTRGIANFLAWPIHLNLTDTARAFWKPAAEFRELPLPIDLKVNRRKFLPPDSPANRYIWARSLTAMREEMNNFINARILLGGRITGFTGKYPGIAEEAFLALRDGLPLYLIGGFGGCTRAVVDALLGKRPEALSQAFQYSDSVYDAMAEKFNKEADAATKGSFDPIDYAALVRFFGGKGISRLNNGLSETENKRLFKTIHIPEMISLVLKGLANIAREPGRAKKA